MGYYFKPSNDADFEFENAPVHLDADVPVPFEDPCRLVRFVDAWAASRPENERGVVDNTVEGIETLREQCRGEGDGTGDTGAGDGSGSVPAPEPPGPPDTTTHDGPAGDEGDTASSTGAPDPPTSADVTTDAPAPGVPDGRPLAEQYYDPRYPLPDYDILQLLPPGEDPDRWLERVVRNEPLPGQRHRLLGRDDRVEPVTFADPVALFSGRYQLAVTDVEIASRGLPLSFRRLYRSGTAYFGPWGFNWDHNYNLHLRELDDGGVAIWTGEIREEVYPRRPDGSFDAPTGVRRRLEHHPGGGVDADHYVLLDREGIALRFERPGGWPVPDRIPLVRIADASDNAQDLTYDAEGRLEQVADDAGRFLRFRYGDCGALEELTDHAGRRWTYHLDDEVEHLVTVVTPGTEERPDGLVTRYVYDRFRSHPALVHNLIQVIDPDGRVVVENEYGAEPGTDDFGRVVCQRQGSFETRFSATCLQSVPRVPGAENVAALRVQVDDCSRRFYTFNYRGDLLDERYRLVRDGSYRLTARIHRFDEQGNRTELREADGHGWIFEYDKDSPDPRARGNVLRVEEVASPLAPAPSRVVFQGTYEPRFQRLKRFRDAEGSELELVYDHELSPTGDGAGLVRELRQPPVTLPDGTTRQTVETFEYNTSGQLTRHEVEGNVLTLEYGGSGLTSGYVTRRTLGGAGGTVDETFEYDAVGNQRTRVDGAGNPTRYEVNALGWPTRVEAPDGAVVRFEYGVHSRPVAIVEPHGDYDDPVLAGRPIRHEFHYDPLGSLVSEVRGANTASPSRTTYTRAPDGMAVSVTDPRGRRLVRAQDERGLVLDEELHDESGAIFSRRRAVWERWGALRQLGLESGPQLHLGYDGFGRLQSVEGPDGSELRYERDPRGLVTQVEIHGPTAASTASQLLARRRFDLDERGRARRVLDVLFRDPLGPFQDIETRYWLDGIGRPVRIEEPGGLVRTRRYSANGVLVSEEDSLGNSVSWELDAAGRNTRTVVADAGPGGVVSREWTRTFDVRGRIVDDADPIGNVVHREYEGRGFLRSATNPSGQTLEWSHDAHGRVVVHRVGTVSLSCERDVVGRVRRVVDPAGTSTELEHDAADRLSRLVRSDGRDQTFAYDDTGALQRFVDFDGTRVDYVNSPAGLPVRMTPSAAAGVAPTPVHEFAYDGMRRMVRATAGGVSHEMVYDSLGRLLEDNGPLPVLVDPDASGREQILHYPDGRRDRQRLDELGRPVETTLDQQGSLDLAAQGVAVGDRLAAFDWAAPTRLDRTRTLDRLTTRHTYDGAGRLAELRHESVAAGAVWASATVRDGLGLKRVERREEESAASWEFRYDGLNRLALSREGLPSGVVPDGIAALDQASLDALAAGAGGSPHALESEFSYSPGDTPAAREDRDPGGVVIGTRSFVSNPLHQIASADGVAIDYDPAGNLVRHGARTYVYDAFRRLVSVEEGGSPLASFDYDPIGRLVRTTVAGSVRDHAYLGNELIQVSEAGSPVLQLTPGAALDRPLIATVPGNTLLLAHDDRGSLVAATAMDGGVLERYRYDVFGEPRILAPDGSPRSASAIGLSPTFLGRPYVPACDLYGFRDRFYHPGLFIYLQPDPFLFADGWSPYSFVHYNAVNFVDPYGRWLHIVVGAVVGAAIGGIGAAISGGDWKDVLVGIGAGAAGGALTAATGNPALGGAVAGGLMGAWSGGRAGYAADGVGGALVGGLAGGAVGAGIGALSGGIGARVGNSVGTRVAGGIFSRLVAREVSTETAWTAGRYGGMVVGGYTGGATAGVFGNVSSTVAADVASGREVTAGQLWDATWHGLVVDGPLGAVGAVSERALLIRSLPGNRGNVLGAEGETLVGRQFGVERANGTERVTGTPSGRNRTTDFRSTETIPEWGAVFEVKNKKYIFNERGGQVSDLADFAANNGAELWVFVRPGSDVAGTVSGIANVNVRPIPQLPLVIPVPVPERTHGDDRK